MSIWYLDPDAVEDYGFDWTAWLEEGETITAQTVTAIGGGLTVTNVTEQDGIVTYRVSAATGTRQQVTCHVTSSSGRQDDKTDTFVIRDQ